MSPAQEIESPVEDEVACGSRLTPAKTRAPKSPRTVRVAVVEDHPDYREALCRAVQAAPGLELIDVCKDLPAAMDLLDKDPPDVLLVDLGLPSGTGFTLIRQAQQLWGGRCNTGVLTVTGHEDHLLTAIGAGAKGYLFKSDLPLEWCQAVNGLATGQSPLHAQLAQRFLKRAQIHPPAAATPDEEDPVPLVFDVLTHSLLQHVAAGYSCAEAAHNLKLSAVEAGRRIRSVYDQLLEPGPGLSPRELQLMRLLNKGYAYKRCAELMGVSESTTKTHATRAYQKLGASNLQTALYEARAAGLLS